MKVSSLLERLEYSCCQGSVEQEVSTVEYDSRKVIENSLFICIKGAVVDGHKFVPDVIAKGAKTLVVQEDIEAPQDVTVIKVEDTRYAMAFISAAYFGHPAEKLKTIGITGTKGKTTATYMVRSILEASGFKTGLIGTIETIIGDTVIPSVNTTPESYVVQESFRKMVDAGCKCVVMEVSSQALMLHRVSGFVFDYGIFTNLEPDHIGPNEHKDLADYIHCKSLLFKQCKHGIFNADAHHLDEVLEGHTCEVETYGFGEDADLRASNVHLMDKGGTLGVAYHMSGALDMDVEIDIPGTFSVYNSMTAIAICRHFGVQKETILNSLSQIRVKGRVEILPVSSKFTLMIDYAHNYISMYRLYEMVKKTMKPKSITVVFGCGGERYKKRREDMGRLAEQYADKVVLTMEDPGFESCEEICKEIKQYITKPCYIIVDREQALTRALDEAQPGELVITTGKGIESTQRINGTFVQCHSDAQVIEHWLTEHPEK